MAETVDIHKLKLAELKQECLARGLDVKGNKSDLINRLQTYLEEHVEEEANEEDVLGDDTEEEEQKPVDDPAKEEPSGTPGQMETVKKVVKITSGVPLEDRLQKRAERFNVPADVDDKKAARAIRFGLSSTEQKAQTTVVKAPVNPEKLKERAQRFGLSVSPITKKNKCLICYFLQRLQKRAERFNVPADVDDKKAARAIRFGLSSTEQKAQTTVVKAPVNPEKLKERAQRFGLSVSPITKKTEDDDKLKKRKERFGIVTSSASITEDTEVFFISPPLHLNMHCLALFFTSLPLLCQSDHKHT
ncbi:SAP domain-containing ribonucleoprotein [Pyxicephalus adspersus]|uniref:SAP domain-containing ribonucleoprotein n=1 Tax=Pyxicephalus adspersus TaxID=30357 RepID=UPI003B5B49D4